MRFLAAVLLAACLVQGNNAELGLGLGGAASGVTGAVGSVATGATGAVGSVATATAGAVAKLPGVAHLSVAAKGMLGSAVTGVSEEKLTETAKDMDLRESYVTIKGAENAISDLAKRATGKLEPVIAGPAAATGCAKEKVEAAATLSKNIANLPVRAAILTKEGVVAYHACSKETSYWGKKGCQALKLTPVTVKAAILLYDTHKYSREATTTVTTLNAVFALCAGKIVA